MKRLASAVQLVFVLGVVGSSMVVSSGQPSEVLLENERVRVKRVILQPAVEYPEHTHELPHVGVIIKGGVLEFHEGGNVERVELKDGDAGWREAGVTHRIVNLSPHPVEVVEVELK